MKNNKTTFNPDTNKLRNEKPVVIGGNFNETYRPTKNNAGTPPTVNTLPNKKE
jgi:hypothetical protein